MKYHEEFEKSKGKKTEIADDPEIFRHVKNTQNISNAAYHGIQTDGGISFKVDDILLLLTSLPSWP